MKFQSRCLVSLFTALTPVLAIMTGCQTSAPMPEQKNHFTLLDEVQRRMASAPVGAPAFETTAFGKQMAKLKLRAYAANLHAHHFMGAHGSKKNPMTLEEALQPGECPAEKATFPMDDGRPCRDQGGVENATILPRANLADGTPDLTDYFRQACEYATHEGELDIFFITPHTKNNGQSEGGQLETSSSEPELVKRQGMLVSMNPDRLKSPKFFCGLGQEASSISTGNHLNIFGQFHAGKTGEEPFFFPSGDFKSAYAEIKERNDAGGKVFLQFNHPDVKADLYWGSLSDLLTNKKRKKTALNDYGLDDFAPMTCLLGKVDASAPECKGVPSADQITPAILQQTFAKMRAAAGNPFRLIEVIPPGVAKEGAKEDDAAGNGIINGMSEGAFGATTNPKTSFRAVHHRKDANTYEDGIFDWIFYLNMGFKLGPTADQDNHHMNYGTATASRTGVLAADLKEATVLDALAARHVFASEDKNARALLSQVSGTVRRIMGDTVKVAAPSTKLQIAYTDPDVGDAAAHVRLYYYRASDPSPYGASADPKAAFHTVSFGAKNQITLPAPAASGRSEQDLIPIQSGEVVTLTLPLTKGVQWVFAEIIQDGDFDKIWTAPLWIERR